MDEVDRLIDAFGSRGKVDHSVWKLDVLMDLGQFDDPRAVALYLRVTADADEPPDVRSDALGRLREATLSPDQRMLAASVGVRALTSEHDRTLRLHAALMLGDLVDIPEVLDALGGVATDTSEEIELRYNAFTSVQRAGPSDGCLQILRALAADELLGQSAQALLMAWGIR